MTEIITAVAITLLITGCAHKFQRGTVAMKTDSETAHVSLGHNDVRVGDKVDFYTNQCRGTRDGSETGFSRDCKMEVLGSGRVSRIFNSHYSEVKTNEAFKFAEGTLVQKQ